jgi:hypothetical protein
MLSSIPGFTSLPRLHNTFQIGAWDLGVFQFILILRALTQASGYFPNSGPILGRVVIIPGFTFPTQTSESFPYNALHLLDFA